MFVGFNVRVECESLVKNCEDSEFETSSQLTREWKTYKKSREKHMLEIK